MELVTIHTSDGLSCEGIFWPAAAPIPQKKLGAVMVHGWTSWYDPRVKQRGFCGSFFPPTAEALALSGIPSVLTMNRGFHAPEFFNDCTLDFQANIQFLLSKGCEEVLIIGHSLGGAKCAYFAGEVGHPLLRGIVLMSAIPSTYNFQGKDELIENARQLVSQGKPHLILPFQEGQTVAIHEAETVLRNFDFAFRGTTLQALEKVAVPLLSLASQGEWSWFKEVTQGIHAAARQAPSVDSHIVEGATDHGYSGYETHVAQVIAEWVKKTLL